MGTKDLHRDTHRGSGYNSTWALRFTAGIRAHKVEKHKSEVTGTQVLPSHGTDISKNLLSGHREGSSLPT